MILFTSCCFNASPNFPLILGLYCLGIFSLMVFIFFHFLYCLPILNKYVYLSRDPRSCSSLTNIITGTAVMRESNPDCSGDSSQASVKVFIKLWILTSVLLIQSFQMVAFNGFPTLRINKYAVLFDGSIQYLLNGYWFHLVINTNSSPSFPKFTFENPLRRNFARWCQWIYLQHFGNQIQEWFRLLHSSILPGVLFPGKTFLHGECILRRRI